MSLYGNMAINIIAFLFFVFLLTACCLLTYNLLSGFSRTQKIAILFLILVSDVILVLEIASLLKVLNRFGYVLLIQLILSAGFVIINGCLKIGFPIYPFSRTWKALREGLSYLKGHRLVSTFALLIALNMVFLAVCILVFPQNITDSLYNHLSRIGYWLQQGSLDHYSGFNNVGMMYPYNNSLLMTAPIIFLKTDRFAGFVQFSAALICCLSIYGISRTLGNKRENSLFAALFLLTYCVIIFESITAQNDLLVAAFISLSIYFLISSIQEKSIPLLILSFLAFSLAVGTNQYSLLVLPGFVLLFFYGLFSALKNRLRIITLSFGVSIILFLCFGSYAYIQNLINFGGIFGPKGFVEATTSISRISEIPSRINTNSSRLFAQFISCDGLPPQLADPCLKTKAQLLRPILASNIESDEYLYGTTRFILENKNVYNAEMAWFGPLSWIVILPSIVVTLVKGVRKKKPLLIIFLLIPISFFIFIQFAKFGWDPYQGRYLIISVVLFQSLTAWIFGNQNIGEKIFTSLLSFLGLFIMVYSTFNNASLPLSSKALLVDLERWGMKNSTLVQKAAYKIKPWLMYDTDVWHMDRIEIMTISNRDLYGPVKMVEENVALNGNLGIMSDFNEFPDYLFRGKQVGRSVMRVTQEQFMKGTLDLEYILLAPEYRAMISTDYSVIDQSDDWVILKLN